MLARLAISFHVHENLPMDQRVTLLAPLLNDACAWFIAGENLQGTEAFAFLILERINDAGLIEEKVHDVSEVGVHPDNREKSGLVAADAQDLTAHMVDKGFNPLKLSLLACGIPEGQVGQDWRNFNEQLARASKGYLAEANSTKMKIVTCWGSHTTAAIRIAKFGARAMHQIFAVDGRASAGKILEMKPSFKEAFKGMSYRVIHPSLVLAVPSLMHVLSRAGNVSHGVERKATCLQMMQAIHRTFSQNPDASAQMCKRMACQGQTNDFLSNYDKLELFVKEWSGGESGMYLQQLEKYEHSLGVKRNIEAEVFAKLAAVKLHTRNATRYVTAIVKTYLNAPGNKVFKGVADVLTQADFNGLQKGGKFHNDAVEACVLMDKASKFYEAYYKGDPDELQVCLDDFEQRLVLHIHKIKCDTRASFKK